MHDDAVNVCVFVCLFICLAKLTSRFVVVVVVVACFLVNDAWATLQVLLRIL